MSEIANSDTLNKVPCIWYPVQFQEGLPKVKALINFGCEVNVMTLAYTAKLDLTTQKTNVGTQKLIACH